MAWNLQTDLLGVCADQDIRPVVFSAAQGKPFADDMLTHEYFKFQKVWVQEQMKKAAGAVWMSALVTIATVSKKLAQTGTKLLGQDTEHFLKNLGNAALTETFQPQFYQQVSKSCNLHLHGDFGLPDVRIGLESAAFLMGAPLAKLQGGTLKEKKGLTAQADLRRLEQLGHLESDFVSRKGCGHSRRPCLLQYLRWWEWRGSPWSQSSLAEWRACQAHTWNLQDAGNRQLTLGTNENWCFGSGFGSIFWKVNPSRAQESQKNGEADHSHCSAVKPKIWAKGVPATSRFRSRVQPQSGGDAQSPTRSLLWS